eukprot:8315119-Lingulodinium_polyedra.AAC.1
MCPDALLALQTAQHEVSCDAIGNAAVAAAYLWQASVAPLRPRHTKAHDGHPWNELVDSLAKWAAVEPSGRPPLPSSTTR